MPRYVGSRPEVVLRINGVPFVALLDTGSQVTTIQQTAFEKYWDHNQLTQPPESWLSIIASNGKPVPVYGYWEPTLQVEGTTLPQQGIIVVQVREDNHPPVVLGMNVLRNCYTEMLEALHKSMPTASPSSKKVIQQTIRVLNAQQKFANAKGEICCARIKGNQPVILKPNAETLLWCRAALGIQGQDYQALVEPINLEDHPLVRAARSLVTVSQGKVPIRLLNLSNSSITLTKHYPVAQLLQVTFQDVISVPAAMTEQQSTQKLNTQDHTLNPLWWKELNVGDTATPEEQIQGVLKVVKEHHQAFSKHPSDYGEVSVIKHNIPTGSHPPIKERYRPIPPTMYQSVKKMIQEMKDSNIIKDSHSPWAAPLVLVRKKDGNIRFCVDYRKINQITHKDAYPLPRIEESLTALGSSAYFSTLDLTSGYWQVPMAPEDREKTAFTTPMGLFEFNYMPFGLCNAPGTFQRLMERCLGHKNFETVLLYLDDVIIYSKSYEDHLKHLAEVFQVLIKHGLKIKPSKCYLLKPEVKYLGHVVSSEGVKPDPEKIAAVRNWPTPTTLKEVRSFLSFAGYYRRFIPHFAQIAEPIQELLRGHPKKYQKTQIPIEWNEDRDIAFQLLKKKLTEPPVLGYPDYQQPFHLYTDASKKGLGAVLSQLQEGKERVIAYASRSLKGSERNDQNYSSFKLEFLALVWAVTEKFKDYLAATPFVAYTDNNPLAHLNTAKLGALEQRWASRLANYNFVVKYRTGKSNENADALSRLPTREDPTEQEDIWEEVEMPAFYKHFAQQDVLTINGKEVLNFQQQRNPEPQVEKERWIKLQAESRVLGELQDFFTSGRTPERIRRKNADPELLKLWRHRKQLFMQKGLMLRRTLDPVTNDRLYQIIVPRRDARIVLEMYHDRSGHFGVQKTEATIRRRFYWVGMRDDIENWCRECSTCAIGRSERHDQRAPLHPIVSQRPLEIVAIDHVKLEPSRSGYTYAMTMIDHYTKFVVAVPVKDLTAKTTANVFWKNFLLPYGCPEKILTDQGSAFESQLFQELCSLHNCQKMRTTAYHPQGNGLCEKMNQTLIEMLRAEPPAKRTDWPTLLPQLMYIYNNTIHCSTGYTPYYLMFGRQGKLPADLTLDVQVPDSINPLPQTDWVSEHQKRLADAQEIVQTRMANARQKQQKDYDQTAKAEPLKIGDHVWLKNNHRTSKLDSKWEREPYTITAIPNREIDIYEITKENRAPQIVHRNRLKLCLKEIVQEETPSTEQLPEKSYDPEEPAPSFGKLLLDSDPLQWFLTPWLNIFVPAKTNTPSLQPEELPRDGSSEAQDVPRDLEPRPVESQPLRRSDRTTKGQPPARYREFLQQPRRRLPAIPVQPRSSPVRD